MIKHTFQKIKKKMKHLNCIICVSLIILLVWNSIIVTAQPGVSLISTYSMKEVNTSDMAETSGTEGGQSEGAAPDGGTDSGETSAGGTSSRENSEVSGGGADSGETGETSAGETSSGEKDEVSGGGADSGETGETSAGETSSEEKGEASDGGTNSGEIGETSAGGTSSGEKGEASGGGTSSGETGETSAGGTSSEEKGEASGGGTSSGETGETSAGGTSSEEKGEASGGGIASGEGSGVSAGGTGDSQAGSGSSIGKEPDLELDGEIPIATDSNILLATASNLIQPLALTDEVGNLTQLKKAITDGLSSFTIVKTVHIPNGETITLDLGQLVALSTDVSGRHFVIENGGKLIIENATTIMGNYVPGDPVIIGGGIEVKDGGTLRLDEGVIIGCAAEFGGGIYANGTFEFIGGTISRCMAERNGGAISSKYGFSMFDGCLIEECVSNANGGGIYFQPDLVPITFTMAGGEISNCIARNGGGVFATKASSAFEFLMNGGKITDCTAIAHGGGGVTITGGTMTMEQTGNERPVISGCIANETSETKWGGYGGGIFVRGGGSAMLKSGLIENCKADSSSCGVGGGIYAEENSQCTIEQIEIIACTATKQGGGVGVSKSILSIKGTTITDCRASDGGGVAVVSGSQCTIGNGSSLTLLSDLQTSSSGGAVYVSGGSLCTIGTNSKITKCKSANGGGILVDSKNSSAVSVLTIAGALITECEATASGGAVMVASGASGIMEADSEIDRCTAVSGGGITVDEKTTNTGWITSMIINNGKITNCTAKSGGGIYLRQRGGRSTEVRFYGGTIASCIGTESGGGICTDGASVIMGDAAVTTEPEIRDCTARGGSHWGGWGGGICIMGNAQVQLNRGQIEACTATVTGGGASDDVAYYGSGGGVYVADGSVCRLDGTIISNCTAQIKGGGIYVTNQNINWNAEPVAGSVLYMSEGTITGCKAVKGGGVYVRKEADGAANRFEMSGGTISAKADWQGGGVYLNGGEMVMQDTALIEDSTAGNGTNTADGQGGGIYLQNEGTLLTMAGGTIQRCKALLASGDGITAYGSGGGIYIDTGAEGDIQSGAITDCAAANHGGGIFVKNHQKLSTTANVVFERNAAVFYSIPADEIPYTCKEAQEISLNPSLLKGRKMPLNNYDINYLSAFVVYHGNGGSDSSLVVPDQYEHIVEYAPFTAGNSIPENNSLEYTVLTNGGAGNSYFEFVRAGTAFGTWSELDKYYVENGGPQYQHPPGDFLHFDRTDIFNQTRKHLNALWTKDIKIEKQINGEFADLTRTFDIAVAIKDPDGVQVPGIDTVIALSNTNNHYVFRDVYIDCSINVNEQLGPISSGFYTVEYYYIDGAVTETVVKDQLSEYDNKEIVVLVKNIREQAVPTGISMGNVAVVSMMFGSIGLISWFAVSCFFNRRRRR